MSWLIKNRQRALAFARPAPPQSQESSSRAARHGARPYQCLGTFEPGHPMNPRKVMSAIGTRFSATSMAVGRASSVSHSPGASGDLRVPRPVGSQLTYLPFLGHQHRKRAGNTGRLAFPGRFKLRACALAERGRAELGKHGAGQSQPPLRVGPPLPAPQPLVGSLSSGWRLDKLGRRPVAETLPVQIVGRPPGRGECLRVLTKSVVEDSGRVTVESQPGPLATAGRIGGRRRGQRVELALSPS